MQKPKKVSAEFYRTDKGEEPVRSFLKALPKSHMKAIGADIRTLEYGWPIGMPVCKHLDDGIWEVRTSVETLIYRVLFCLHEQHLVLLNAFLKKTQKTPKRELDLAIERRTKLERRK